MRSLMMIFAAALALVSATPCLAAEIPPAISAAIADSARPAADTARDAQRKPAEVLAYAGIKPGMQVAELFPGGGYFTRLLSVTTGSGGHIYALTPLPGADGKDRSAAAKAIAADTHYGNVTALPLDYGSQALGLPQQVDVVWTSDNYHDMINALAAMSDIDLPAALRHVYQSLKPGGVFIVIDHASTPGRGSDDSKTLHRIDPETVKAQITAAGFQFAGNSDILHNPDDPHTAKVFDPAIQGKTDQFILKFTK